MIKVKCSFFLFLHFPFHTSFYTFFLSQYHQSLCTLTTSLSSPNFNFEPVTAFIVSAVIRSIFLNLSLEASNFVSFSLPLEYFTYSITSLMSVQNFSTFSSVRLAGAISTCAPYCEAS